MNFFTPLFVLFLCSELSVVCESCAEGQFQSSSSGLCCKLCPAGSFMTKECTVKSNDTHCQACPPDKYSHIANNWNSCRRCTTECLDKNKIIVSACNSTKDAQCECPSASFWDRHLLKCTKCTKCMQGERLVTPCTTHKDAKCKSCAKGTYLNSAKECVPCDYCKKGQLVLEVCTEWQNTRCKWIQPNTYPSVKVQLLNPTTITPRPSRSKNTPSQVKRVKTSQEPNDAQEESMPVGFWVLVAIVILQFLLILYLLCGVYSKRRHETSGKNTHCKNGVRKDTVVTSGSPEAIIKENNIKLSRIPADVVERLAFHLNAQNGKNWKHLAGLLGYTSDYTQNWELTPTEATQKLLQDWQQRSSATVFVLYVHLKKLHRDDAAAVLLPFLTGQASECETV